MLAVEPILRPVVRSRLKRSRDVDDVVQDGLERLFGARERLAPGAVLPYAVVIGWNLVASHARKSSLVSARYRRLDHDRFPAPEDEVIRDEERRAMRAAMACLSDGERSDLVVREAEEMAVADVTAPGARQASTRLRLAPSRAKLRVEYSLAIRRVELPTSRCRTVLMALSGGDMTRQLSVRVGDQLVACSTRAALADSLRHRCDMCHLNRLAGVHPEHELEG